MRIIFMVIFLLILAFSVNANIAVNIEIPASYLVVNPGDSMYVNLKLFKIGDSERNDYYIKVYVADEDNKVVLEKTREIAVDNEATTVVNFNLPENIMPGNYKIVVNVDNEKKASSEFVIEKKEANISSIAIYAIITIFLGFFIVFYLFNRKLNKIAKYHNKVGIDSMIRRKRRWR